MSHPEHIKRIIERVECDADQLAMESYLAELQGRARGFELEAHRLVDKLALALDKSHPTAGGEPLRAALAEQQSRINRLGREIDLALRGEVAEGSCMINRLQMIVNLKRERDEYQDHLGQICSILGEIHENGDPDIGVAWESVHAVVNKNQESVAFIKRMISNGLDYIERNVTLDGYDTGYPDRVIVDTNALAEKYGLCPKCLSVCNGENCPACDEE